MLEIFEEKTSLIPTDETLAIAVSGGADSTCMTLLFSKLKKISNIRVLIVDHKLRSSSTAEAIAVQKYLFEKFSFKAKILTWDRNYEIKSNVQSQARDARYKLLRDYCKRFNIKYLCTAHNKNDQTETVLLNIMRGTGLEGLVGIREVSQADGITLLRPLLTFSREEIINYLTLHEISWVEDPSNYNQKYERVKIRRVIETIKESNLVNAPKLISRINLLSENALRASSFIKNYADKKIDEICEVFPLNVIVIDVAKLLAEDSEIILRILSRTIKTCGGAKYSSRGPSLIKLYNLLIKRNSEGKFFDVTLGGCMVWYSLDREKNKVLVIAKEKVRNAPYALQTVRKNEVSKLKKMILDGDIEALNYDLYQAVVRMIKLLPGVNKILCRITFYEQEVKGEKMHFYPELGILTKII